jgi:hypothetical protein
MHYWHNPDPTNALSAWHDERLPVGWAWWKKSDASPKLYVNLYTGERSEARPEMPAVPLDAEHGPRPAKRARIEEQHAPVAPAPILVPRKFALQAFMEPPSMPQHFDTFFFQESHARVLRQVQAKVY